MDQAGIGALPAGLWRFEATHPDWTVQDGGEEGWEADVAWWALASSRGLLLVDPLVEDWEALDRLVAEHGGCAGVVRLVHWHQRSVADAAERYGAPVLAAHTPAGEALAPIGQPLSDGQELWDGIRAFALERQDEIALWLAQQRALLFGDAMLRSGDGSLRVCPDSWVQPPEGGPARLRSLLGALAQLPVEHVLVSHGPPVLGGGAGDLRAALAS